MPCQFVDRWVGAPQALRQSGSGWGERRGARLPATILVVCVKFCKKFEPFSQGCFVQSEKVLAIGPSTYVRLEQPASTWTQISCSRSRLRPSNFNSPGAAGLSGPERSSRFEFSYGDFAHLLVRLRSHSFLCYSFLHERDTYRRHAIRYAGRSRYRGLEGFAARRATPPVAPASFAFRRFHRLRADHGGLPCRGAAARRQTQSWVATGSRSSRETSFLPFSILPMPNSDAIRPRPIMPDSSAVLA